MRIVSFIGFAAGIAAVFTGFALAYAGESKRELVGNIIAVAGLLLFFVCALLVFVPGFFSN